MSTSVDFMEYIVSQLRDAPEISWKKMFGEYGVYSEGKIFALVCDNQLFVKPTEAGRELLGDVELAPPYDGAKPYFLISELDDRDFLRELAERTCAALPEPKPRKKRKAKEKAEVKQIVETDRLYLRRLAQDDFEDLCRILQDEKAMYAYEHAFSDQEVHEWLDRQLARYEEYGFGLWAVILKETGELIGQCGITKQDCGGTIVPEIGYLFRRDFWHQGYAAEAALACKKYGFEILGMDELFSIIRPENGPSRRVAEKNGMQVRGQFIKRYYNMDMPHLIYSVQKPD